MSLHVIKQIPHKERDLGKSGRQLWKKRKRTVTSPHLTGLKRVTGKVRAMAGLRMKVIAATLVRVSSSLLVRNDI